MDPWASQIVQYLPSLPLTTLIVAQGSVCTHSFFNCLGLETSSLNPIIFCQGTHLLHTHSHNFRFPLHLSFCCSCHCHLHDHNHQWHLCAELHHCYYLLRCYGASSTGVTLLVRDSDLFYQNSRIEMSIPSFFHNGQSRILEFGNPTPASNACGFQILWFLEDDFFTPATKRWNYIVHSKISPKIRINKKEEESLGKEILYSWKKDSSPLWT